MIEDFKIILSKNDFKYLIFLFFGMLISAVIEMIGLGSIPIFIMVIVDINSLINKFPDFFAISYIKNLDQTYITIYGGLALILIFLIKNIYLAIFLFFQGKVIRILKTNITRILFNKYIKASYNFHIKNNPSVLTRNIVSSVAGTVNSVLSTLTVTRESLVLVVVFILLFLNEPTISLSVFIFLISISGLFLYLTRKSLITRGQELEFVKQNQLKTINHAIGSIRETKILNRENYLINIFNKQVDDIEKQAFFMNFIYGAPRLFLEFIAIFAISVISILFVLIDLTNNEILPIVSLLAVCSIRLIPAFNSIVSSMSSRRFSLASVKIISTEFKNVVVEEKFNNENLSNQRSIKTDFFQQKIKFDNVFFSHADSNAIILKNIFLEIAQGQKIGIIGKSGAGKSTLIDLILGLIRPVSGKIFLDDANLHLQDNLRNWQKLIGYVPQDIYLLDDTIKNNIAFGLNPKDIDQKAILNSIKLANLEKYIGSLDKKENTIVGNRGIRVSGGQKQRIGIARALYTNPKVLILDEATSSLDSINEKKVIEEVYKASDDKTLIIITHRHSSVFNCDKVFLLDKGQIMDEGKYEDLKNRNVL